MRYTFKRSKGAVQVLEITPAQAPMAKYPESGKRLVSRDFIGDATSEERSSSSVSGVDGIGKGKSGRAFGPNAPSMKWA